MSALNPSFPCMMPMHKKTDSSASIYLTSSMKKSLCNGSSSGSKTSSIQLEQRDYNGSESDDNGLDSERKAKTTLRSPWLLEIANGEATNNCQVSAHPHFHRTSQENFKLPLAKFSRPETSELAFPYESNTYAVMATVASITPNTYIPQPMTIPA
jgi:hypothetical protein